MVRRGPGGRQVRRRKPMTRKPVGRAAVAAVASLALGAALLAATSLPAAADDSPGGSRERDGQLQRVAYFVQWGIYARQYFVKNVATSGQAARLTTINYAFGSIAQDGTCTSLDGFTASTFFSDAALTPESRAKVVASCIDLFIKGNLPGAPGAAAGVFD